MQQLDGPNDAEDNLNVILKFDAANFGQRQSSHVGDWGCVSLSSGMWIGWTTDLDSLGSNKPMYMVLAL